MKTTATPVPVTVGELTVRYGAAAAVDRVSLAIEAGELFLLLGPSGCGKTTLLRAVAGFVGVDAGTIRFGDEDVTRLPAHARNAGMVFQSFALWPHLSVFENVAFGLRERRVPKEEIAARVDAALASTRLPGKGARRIDELSAASSSASRSRARSSCGRAACCSTSRCRTSTRSFVTRCATRSGASARSTASRRST